MNFSLAGFASAKKLDVPYFYQCDERWRNDQMGTPACNLCSCGCAVTCVAMVLNYYGVHAIEFSFNDYYLNDANPKDLNKWLKENNGYINDWIKWSKVEEYSDAKSRGVDLVRVSEPRLPIKDIEVIKDEINAGYPVIVDVGGHWVVITGVDEETYYINDPLRPEKKILDSYTIIYKLRVYHGVPSVIPKAIWKGLNWLRSQQNPDGSWTYSGRVTEENVGLTSLAIAAFLNYGINESDETVRKAINWILSKKKSNGAITNGWFEVYDTSLAILALVATNNQSYYDTIKSAVNFLINTQNDEGEFYTRFNWSYGGWGYNSYLWYTFGEWADLSNTQFALLALYYAEEFNPNDKIVPDEVWRKAEIFVTRCQNREESNPNYSFYDDGGFIYQPGSTLNADGRSYASMTTAGLWSFYVILRGCDERTADAWRWIENNYYIDQNYPIGQTFLYYYLYSLAKACLLWDVKEINGHDWYEEMAEFLISKQEADGHWSGTDPDEEPDNVATCWALLALESKYVPPKTALSFKVLSPVDLHVYDPEGRHVGINYTTGLEEIEIPGATYSGASTQPQIINISGPMAGTYTIRLVGKERGNYTYIVQAFFEGEIVSEESFTGFITPGEIHESKTIVSAIAGPITVENTAPMPTKEEVPAPTPVPEFTSIGFIMSAVGIFLMYVLLRRRE